MYGKSVPFSNFAKNTIFLTLSKKFLTLFQKHVKKLRFSQLNAYSNYAFTLYSTTHVITFHHTYTQKFAKIPLCYTKIKNGK